MVAVVSGNNLGLFNSSLSSLGSGGAAGTTGQQSRSGERLYVNSVTGNLVVQSVDETVVATGLDLALVRTYNSQGLLNDDNGDNWRLGIHRRVYNLTGTVNTAGSTITKTFGDGADIVYTYNATLGYYVGTDGDGAHDTLAWSAGLSQWTWTDGSTRNTETYNAAGALQQSADSDGHVVTYTYTGNLLTRVLDASGQETFLDYTGNNLTQVRVVISGVTQTITRYTYDGQNRLSTVRVDLSPEDNSVTDNNVYLTTYTYDGTSKRIASIAQGNNSVVGSTVSFTYELSGGQYRVKTFVDGEGKVTTFNYTTGATELDANEAVLETTDTVETPYNLNSSLLTFYRTYILEQSNGNATQITAARVSTSAFRVVWVQDDTVFTRQYDVSTNVWGSSVNISSTPAGPITGVRFSPDAGSGNYIVTWILNGNTVRSVQWVSGAWQGISNLVTVAGGVTLSEVSGSINGNGQSAVTWLETSGSTRTIRIRRRPSSSWLTAETVNSVSAAITAPRVSVLSNNNVQVVWRRNDAGVERLYTRGYNGSWSSTPQISASGSSNVTLFASAAAGTTAHAAWVQGNNLYRNSGSAGTWAGATLLVSTTSAITSFAFPSGDYANSHVAYTTADGNVWVKRVGASAELVGSGTSLSELAIQTYNGGDTLVSWRSSTGGFNFNRYDVETGVWVLGQTGSTWPNFTNRSPIYFFGDIGGAFIYGEVVGGAANLYTYHSVPGGTYTIQSGDTWASIGAYLYGSSAVASQLQTALGNQSLTPGQELEYFPATITVTTEQTVPAYYIVQAGDTWASIAQTVYGTSAAEAVAALQSATGNPTLTTGLHLTVPLTLSYGDGPSELDIVSPLGLTTTIQSDDSGRMTAMLSPTVGGARLERRYAYDADGNVTSITEDPTGANRVTTNEYDANGNLLLTRDSLGNTVTRTYSATNQLVTETAYAVPDPDGAGTGQPTAPMTTRYAYDAESHLRFTVSAEGRVTEFRYDTAGNRTAMIRYVGGSYDLSGLAPNAVLSESQLSTWVGAQDLTKIERTDYAYDPIRSSLMTATAFATTDASGNGVAAGASITRYVYDQRGRLLKQIDPRGEATTEIPPNPSDYVTTFTYDGLGRMLAAVRWTAAGNVSTAVNTYNDGTRTNTVTLANGLVTTTAFDRVGRVLTVSASAGQALGTTTYTYDNDGRLRMVTDPVGVRTHHVYDAAGRKIFTVDGDGSLTEYIYDRVSNIVKTVQYAVAANTTLVVDGGGLPIASVDVTALRNSANGQPAQNRVSRAVYDSSHRVVYTIDAGGNLARNFYDGASRLTDTLRYATPVSISASIDELVFTGTGITGVTITTSADDRLSRLFYDNEGRMTGALDGAGYLVRNFYNGAGELIQTIAYADDTDPGLRTSGTLAQLEASITASATDDVVSYFFYDGQGRRIGVLDGERYLTQTLYDAAGNVAQQIRYPTQRTFTGTPTFAGVLPANTNGAHITSYEYDEQNRVTLETNFEGTVTEDQYDNVGNLIKTTRALGVDPRVAQARYDALGRVTAELTPEGSVALAALGGSPTQQDIDGVWAQYGVSHAYDLAGRRVSSTDQNGHVTLFFYDADARLRFTTQLVEGNQAEVAELRYNALGQVTSRHAYVNRISSSGLSGGDVTTTLTTRVTGAADPTKDLATTYTYALTGQVATQTTAEGGLTTNVYNAFGAVSTSTQLIEGSTSIEHRYAYDRRGLLTLTRWDPNGLNTTEAREYDAFGRVTEVTDARGNVRTMAYDRLGRSVQLTDPLLKNTVTTYDAFSRVLTVTDRLTNVTQYAYNDTSRSVTVTTPENIQITTARTRHGETATVTDARGTITTYEYDVNGQLKRVFDPLFPTLGNLSELTYDHAGLLIDSKDANGVVTHLTYDAASRVFTRAVDPAGLNLVTTYQYDGRGQAISTTDERGVTTVTAYTRDGQVASVTVQMVATPNIVTTFSYDKRGSLRVSTEGAGSANPRTVTYAYDVLGRRTGETVVIGNGQPDAITQYRYDANGNVTRKIDAANHSTWYVYDANDRLRYTIDALGGVTESKYDDEGRVTETRRHATALDPQPFASIDVIALATFPPPADSGTDRVTQTVFDRDGRVAYALDIVDTTAGAGQGIVTAFTYDGNGNVVRQRVYASTVASSVPRTVAGIAGALTANPAVDRESFTAYDVRNRATFEIDALGSVNRLRYDGAGNVVERTAFATLRPTTSPPTEADMVSWAAANSLVADRVTRAWYDAAGRAVFQLDAEGYITETRHTDGTRIEEAFAYVTKPADLSGASTLAQVRAAVDVIDGNALDRHTRTEYDRAGRIAKSVEVATGAYEEFTYDAVGNRTRYRNKAGSEWNYVYDANRRLIEERSPLVAVTTVVDVAGTLQGSIANAEIVTRMTYDALGNVLTRTEAFGRPEARTTSYVYDALGRQTRTNFPSVGVYNAAGDSITLVGAAVVRTETVQSLFSEVTYDALGNAVRNQNVAGDYSHKAYDRLGRLRYEVDAERFVSEYRYDVFGNVAEQIRYTNALDGTGITDATILSEANVAARIGLNPAADRTLTQTYDRLNRVTRVEQPLVYSFEPAAGAAGGVAFTARPTTDNTYNAFGELVRQSRLANPTGPITADTYFYFDERGLLIGEVDPLGYVTTLEYDALGNSTRKVEYARPLTAGAWNLTTFGVPAASTPTLTPNDPLGYDRDVVYAYDVLDRLTSESRVGVEFTQIVGGAPTVVVADDVTSYGYDALGNRTRVTNQAGASTYSYYDVLGRVVAAAEPARDPGNGTTLIPLAEMRHDAFGNIAEQIQYANGASEASATYYAAATGPVRTTSFERDRDGNAVRTKDPMGANRYASYNARGQIAKEWQPVTNNDSVVEALVSIYEYDRLGQQLRIRQPQTLPVGGGDTTPVLLLSSETRYNPFGEVTFQGVNGTQEYFDYDQAGRVWRTNSGGGVDKVFFYNLAGQATVELRAPSVILKSGSFPTPQSVAAVNPAALYRTETRYDLRGSVVEQRLPAVSAQTTASAVQVLSPTIGDLQISNNPAAGYVRVDLGEDGIQYYYVPMATIEQGGGYYIDGNGEYVLDLNYQVLTERYVSWDAPSDLGAVKVFEYRPAGNPSGAWASAPIVALPNNRVGVNVQLLDVGDYEYRLTHTRADASTPYQRADGIFTINGAVSTGLAITMTPADDAGTVAAIRTAKTGGISWDIINSNHFGDPSPEGYLFWFPFPGKPHNEVVFRFDPVEGPVVIEFDYMTVADTISHFAYPAAQRTMVLRFEDGSQAAAGIRAMWNDPYTNRAGGVGQILDARVYGIPPGGDKNSGQVLLYSTKEAVQRDVLEWIAPRDPTVTVTFEVRRLGTTTWTPFAIERRGMNFAVDPKILDSGDWEYQVAYQRNSVATASATGTFRVVGSDVLLNKYDELYQGEEPFRPVPNDQVAVTDIVAYDDASPVTISVTSSAENDIQSLFTPAQSLPQDYRVVADWEGTNSVELTWADVGAGPVRVELDYLSTSRYFQAYSNRTNTGQAGASFQSPGFWWDLENTDGIEMSRTFEFGSAATGATLTWTDDPDGLHGGIESWGVRQVRIYTQVGGDWVLQYTRDGATRLDGRSLQWRDLWSEEPTFEIRAVGTTTWQVLTVDYNLGEYNAVDLNSFADGDYDYRLSQETWLPDGESLKRATAMGTVSIGPSGVTLTQTGIVYGDGAGDLGDVTASGNTISWTAAPEAGATVTVRHLLPGATAWQEQTISGTGPSFSAVLAGADRGVVDYEILYTRNGETVPYAVSRGGLVRDLDHLLVKPRADFRLTQVDTLTTSPLPVTGITSSGHQFLWNTEARAGDTIEFRYWQGTNPFSTLTVTQTASGYAANISALAFGTYNYEIRYVANGQSVPYVVGTGTFDVFEYAAGGTPTISVTTTSFPEFLAETPTIEQTVDRWGNALAVNDVFDNTTDYRYNQADQLLSTTMPLVDVLDTRTGMAFVQARPVTQNHYDFLGRLIGTTDANGNFNSVAYNAGNQAVAETHADGGVKSFVYDAFGNQTDVYDELGFRTRNTFDDGNRRTRIEQEMTLGAIAAADEAQILTTDYVYDEAARVLRETNDESETTRSWYDLQGNLRRRQTPRGFNTTFVYDTRGNKTRETDALGNSLQWTYDYFRLTSQRDLLNSNTTYFYDRAGSLSFQSGSYARSVSYTYDVAGRLTEINESTGSNTQGLLKVARSTDYQYDIAGRRTSETLTVDGIVHTDARMVYDALGRLTYAWDLRYSLSYGYDAQSNRTRTYATYFQHTQTPKVQELWYTYDNMNRVAISQGANISGTIGINTQQGVELTYDLAGERHTARSYGEVYRLIGHVVFGGVQIPIYQNQQGYSTETYGYDGAGRLTTVQKDDILQNTRSYDGASRELADTTVTLVGDNEVTSRTRTSVYDDDGRTVSQTTLKGSLLENVVTYGDSTFDPQEGWSQGFDAAGNLRGYSTAVYENGSPRYSTSYTIGYQLRHGYQEINARATSVVSAGAPSRTRAPANGETNRYYNVAGELVRFEDVLDKDRYFANNARGQATTVIEGEYGGPSEVTAYFRDAITRPDGAVKAQHFFFLNDNLVGSFGQLQNASGQFKANFDTNYTAISADYPASVPSQVVVQSGETLRHVAARVFGDPALWYVLAEENGLTNPDEVLQEGRLLRVPNEVVSLRNTATTFKPYSASEAIGDTTPTQPSPPVSKGCGVLGQIILIAVVLVVSIYTAGAFAGLLGALPGAASAGTGLAALGSSALAGTATGIGLGATIGVGAIAGIAGSIASQGLAVLTGYQDSIDWDGVMRSAISGGVTAGLGKTGFFDKLTRPYVQSAVQGATGNALTQGVARIFKFQEDKFSWREVAISSASAVTTGQATKNASNLVDRAIYGGLTSAGTRRILGGEIDAASVIADIFGNMAGNAIVENTPWRAPRGRGPSNKPSSEGALDNNPEKSVVIGEPSPDEQRSEVITWALGDPNAREPPLQFKLVSDAPTEPDGGAAFSFENSPALNSDDYRILLLGGAVNGFLRSGETIGSGLGIGLYNATHGEYDSTWLGQTQADAASFVADELLTLGDEGFAATSTSALLSDVGGTLDQIVNIRGISGAVADGYRFAVEGTTGLFEFADRTWSEATPEQRLDFAGNTLGESAFNFGGGLAAERTAMGLTRASARLGRLEDRATSLLAGLAEFRPLGVTAVEANTYLESAAGKMLLGDIRNSDLSLQDVDVVTKARDFVMSGATVPRIEAAPARLVKIVPEGESVSSRTGFFTTPQELSRVSRSGQSLADAFGLPFQSQRGYYSIYEITPMRPTSVYVSPVAPTAQFGGAVKTSGGATQYIVSNRRLFTEPRFVGGVYDR